MTVRDFAKRLQEGTWCCPYSMNKAKAILALLKHPITAADAEHLMYNLYGDDKLFDAFLEPKDPDDVRPEIIAEIKNLVKDIKANPEGWYSDGKPTTWDPDVVKVLKQIGNYKISPTQLQEARKNTSEKLSEGTARYSFSRSKEESGDLQGARIYSPTLDEVFGHGSFRNAYEAAELFQNELKSQGNRKTGEKRGLYSLASNIFSAALGTETFDEPGVREEGKEHDPRLRNTAYAVINPRTGEEVNVKWDIPYPKQDLSDTNLEKYLADQEKFRKGQETYNTEDFKKKSEEDIEANSKKLGKAKRDTLTPEILDCVKTTQDPENLKAYKDYATDWAKSKYPNVVEFVSDTLRGSKENTREDIWHIDWAGEINSGNTTDIGTLFLNWLNNQLDLAQRASSNFEQDEKTYNRLIQKFEAANNTIALKNMEHNVEQLKKEKEKNKKEKEDLKKAMAYAEAVNNLWSIGSGRVMRKIADPNKRETFKLK